MDTILRSLSASLSPRHIVPPYAWVEHIPFALYLMETMRPKRFVELGVHTGNSYLAFCQAVDVFHLETTCTGVDTFAGDEHAGRYASNVYEELTAYHDPLYGQFSTLKRSTFDEALAEMPDASIDLLHIDGYHTLDAVEHDFSGWLPKMSPQGVVILHDINVWRDQFGVWRLWQDIKNHFPSLEFAFSHGLGIVAVGKTIPPVLSTLFAEPELTERTFYLLGSRIRYEHLACQAKIENEKPVLSRLYIDRGAEFSERDSMSARFDPETKQVHFDISAFPDAKRLRFDPMHDSAVITLVATSCEDSSGNAHTLTPSGHNALYQDNGIFDFAARNPRFIFTIPEDITVQTVTVAFDVLHGGMAAQSYILNKIHRELATVRREAGNREARLLAQIESLEAENTRLHQQNDEFKSLPGVQIGRFLKQMTALFTTLRPQKTETQDNEKTPAV
ncbi:class I SAM-dependent methyltransferase [Desulfovibrio inopinatus]|uniref:class I SAM-dependent methyltransferase n=1 Tax=Desulfovibrio inopinatus TaxID=102109 RepID=UPI00040A24E9|nr:class I SAM-dependent methyltransferase [Desulfovibrio inopinatus]